jgi:hypothetical protein
MGNAIDKMVVAGRQIGKGDPYVKGARDNEFRTPVLPSSVAMTDEIVSVEVIIFRQAILTPCGVPKSLPSNNNAG